MVTNIFQVIVIAVLAFVLMFGIGFILNMLLKTTWLTVYLYLALIVGLFAYFGWGTGNLFASLLEYGIIDWLAVAGGLAGAYVSGVTIRTLRVRGFKMF
ncbi:YuiB family protein [Paenibacillus antri]|uniref:YuiB family protein n=1 Tax=Paenibacillus antri TaxID=2582848 RepID=UPI001EE3E1EC|nr:YuiB family protein [Paenibacillus antri]